MDLSNTPASLILVITALVDLANGTLTEDEILSPEEEASVNVDALVSDAVDEHQGRSTPLLNHILNQPRRATPTIPPGFTAPVFPRNVVLDEPSRPASRNAAPVAPAVPVIPVTTGRAATPISKKTKKEAEGTTTGVVKSMVGVTSTPAPVPATPVKANRKASPSKAKAQTVETPKKHLEEPVNTTQKESSPTYVSPVKATPKSKASGKKAPTVHEVTPQKDTKVLASTVVSSSKRQPLGKLDISAATNVPENEAPSAASSTKQEALVKPIRTVSTTAPISVPASPATVSTGSPIKKPIGAKTLRVVATPKTESPPQMPSFPSLPQVPTVEKLRSRQASIASINQPGTPASELISDTASFTSTSISRASSPPLIGGKVGSAPIRKKTKSQAKKDRQERARQAEEERAIEEQTPEPEVVQAPIVGRKKKAKKPVNPKIPATSTKSQPEPTKISSKEDEELEELYQANMAAKRAAADAAAAAAAAADVAAADAAAAAAAAIKSSASSPRAEPVAEPEPETAKDKREPIAQTILTDLQRTGELVTSALEFFKPLSSSLAHASKAIPMSGGPVGPPDLKIHFTEADLEALTKKQPVHLRGHDGTSDSRTLITPQGKFFWGLTQELEEKALELEKYIEELKGATRFHPKKHTAHNTGFQGQPNLPALATALKEAGAKLSKSTGQDMPRLDSPSAYQGGPSQRSQLPSVQANEDLLPPNQAQQPQTPADAGVYLNQFVLPNTDNPPPNAPRPEMAAVGGLPGAGTANMSVNANKLVKAAKAVAEGGAVGPELEGIGAITADLLGGVFVQNLEALVGADLGFSSFGSTDIGIDGSGLDVQGLVSAFEAGVGAGPGAFEGGRRRGGRSVLNVEEAEQAMLAAKKDHEALEKKLSVLIKRNKKMLSAGKA